MTCASFGRTKRIIVAANASVNPIVRAEPASPGGFHERDHECQDAPGCDVVDSRTGDGDRTERGVRQVAIFKDPGEHRKGSDAHRNTDE